MALSFLSTTQDRTVAESFGRLRKTNGTELIGKLPEKAITVDCDLRFPYDGKHSDGPLLIAKQMEEK